MPIPTSITDLSTTASSNSPTGAEGVVDGDNFLRAHAAFIAQLNARSDVSESGIFYLDDYLSSAQKADRDLGTPLLDLTTPIQSAITAAYGKTLRIPAGNYRITAALNVLSRLKIVFEHGAKLLLATQNQNGLVVGDGTESVRTATFSTVIENFAANPYDGVTAFTSGAALYLNYVAFVNTPNVSIYGKDSSARKLFHGVRMLRATECDAHDMVVQEMVGSGIYCEGQAGTANRTVDCNFDRARLLSCGGDSVYWGTDTAGLGLYRPIIYGTSTGYSVRINSTAGANGQNYFITDPDIEVSATGAGGVYVQSGQALKMSGSNWIGAPAGVKAIWFGASADSCNSSVDVKTGLVQIDGPANSILGGDISGDNATAGSGIVITSTAIDTKIASGVRVRQWVTNGINITGNPARVVIGDVIFRSNGKDINGLSGYTPLVSGPIVGRCQTDKLRTGYTAAATVAVPETVDFVQITGGTTVTTIPVQGVGSLLTIQAGSGGITLGSGGNLQLRSAPLSVAAFKLCTLRCDGVDWHEV